MAIDCLDLAVPCVLCLIGIIGEIHFVQTWD